MSNMVINTNILALNSHRAMKSIGSTQSKASEKLSSGLRVNSAADDAAGLAISEKMRGQIRGLKMASKNAQDGISLIQTAEGGMQEVDNMVQRIRELVVQAANDTNDTSSADRVKIQGEISALLQEIDNMSGRVEFNKKKIISGTFSSTGSTLHLQVGANSSANAAKKEQSLEFNIGGMSTATLGLDVHYSGQSNDVSDKEGSAITGFIATVDTALERVTVERAKLGAIQNRLEFSIKSLDISSENLSSAESRIRDTDMAQEMMNLTKSNVLSQAATSMLAQANQAPQNVLQLLR